MIDLNDAGPQRPDGVIPDGTFARVHLTIRPGGYAGPKAEPDDYGLLRAGKSGDTVMLDCEFTVLLGPHKGRRVWQYLVVAGGSLDEHGVSKAWNVSKQLIRAMIDSSRGLSSTDNSPAAQAHRQLPNFRTLNNIEFAAKIGVDFDQTGEYSDKNVVQRAVTAEDDNYRNIMTGVEVPPKPTSRRKRNNDRAAPTQKPAWETSAPQQQPGQWGAQSQPQSTHQMPMQQQTEIAYQQQQPGQPIAYSNGAVPQQNNPAPVPNQGAGPEWLRG